MSEVVAILFVVVVLPLVVVLHYVTKWKSSRVLSKDEERMLEVNRAYKHLRAILGDA